MDACAIHFRRSSSVKTARITDEDDDSFCLEYDNNLGQKNTMRLDATTYERAVREAKSFLGIDEGNLDGDGIEWKFENSDN
jgi:hypothetical protein